MSGPITWRTIQQPTGASEAAGLMAGAQRSIAGGFDAFSDIIKQRELTQAANVGVENNIQKQDFLDILSGARTPEELAALAPQIEAARAGMSVGNRAATRDAEATRSSSLMAQLTAGNKFSDDQLARTRVPLIAKANEYITNNDQAGLKAFLDANDLGDESKFITAGYNTNRAREADGRADALAPGAQEAALNAQAFALQLRPQAQANTLAQGKLTGQTITSQGEVLASAAEDRLVANLTAKASQERLASLSAGKTQLGGLASELKLPVDAGGAPNIAAMDDAMLKRLDAEATKRGLPTSAQLYAGDTASKNQFLLDLSGRVSPAALARNENVVSGAFNSTGQNALVGNDAATVKLREAQAQVEQQERDAGNWYAPGSPTAKSQYEELAANAASLIDTTTGFAAEEDVADIQNLIYEMGTTGLEVRPGVFLTPSVNDMRAALRAAPGGWLEDNKRAENAKRILKKMLNTDRVTGLIQDAEKSKAANKTMAVRALLNAPPPGKK